MIRIRYLSILFGAILISSCLKTEINARPAYTPVSKPHVYSLAEYNQNHVVDDITLSRDGKTLAIASNGYHFPGNNTSGFWLSDIASEIPLVIEFSTAPMQGVIEISHDGQLLALSGFDCKRTGEVFFCGESSQQIKVFDLRTKEAVYELSANKHSIVQISFTHDDKKIIIQNDWGDFLVWNFEANRIEHTFSYPSNRGSIEHNFSLNAVDSKILIGNGTGADILDTETGNLLSSITGPGDGIPSTSVVAFEPSGQRFAISRCVEKNADICIKRDVAVYDSISNIMLRSLTDINYRITTLQFSPDAKIVAIGAWDGLQLWNLETDQHIHVDAFINTAILDMAFTPDGKTLIVGSNTGLHLLNLSEIDF